MRGALKATGAKTQHKATGVKTQDSWPPLERATEEKEKESSAKAKAKAKVQMAEKYSEKERAKMAEKEADGALQLHHRLLVEKEPMTGCATTVGSGAILAKTAQFRIVEKLWLDHLRRRPTKRRFSRRRQS